MNDTILELKNARVYRGETQVFDQLDLKLITGEHTAILGPNGSGKTTLLKMLTREISPVVQEDSHIRIFGSEQTNIWHLRKKLGIVSHEFQTRFDTLASGIEVVISAFFGSVGLHEHHFPSKEHIQKAEEKLSEFHIENLRDKQYLKLSAGQQRRLLLARATIHEPEVIVFDEPTASLDVAASFQLINDMRALAAKGVTIVLVTHHIQEIIPEVSRVILLKSGNIVQDGTKEDTLKSDTLSNLFDTQLEVQNQSGFYQWYPAS